MKKVIFVLLVIALLIVGYSHDQFVWCKKLLFGDPTTHVIQKGEYLSAIAKQYYGRADYWRELALVNRAPDSDLIHPGEEIIVPSLNVIKEIRRTRWLSKVNSYVKNEEDIIARLNRGEQINLAENKSDEPKTSPEMMTETGQNEAVPAQEPTSTPTQIAQQNNEPEHAGMRSTTSPGLTLGVIALVLAASVVAFVLIRRKKHSQPIAIVDDHELNLLGDDDESEPDYHEYLQKKSRRKEDVLGGQK
jgi:LysM repeat protein